MSPAPKKPARQRRPRLAVFKLASCDGCQLSLLDCEDELLQITGAVEIAEFLEASRVRARGPFDVTLVEGSITTAHDAARIEEIRQNSKMLVAIGACATAGGIQALRNFADVAEFTSLVYAGPEYIETLATSTPVSAHVTVDYELRGCPVNKTLLLEVLAALLAGRRPNVPSHAVCVECKARGAVCVLVASGTPCLGPVTQAGCGAICPAYHRGCYGCFGPSESPNTASLARTWTDIGASNVDLVRAFRSFNPAAEPFRKEGDAQERAGLAALKPDPARETAGSTSPSPMEPRK